MLGPGPDGDVALTTAQAEDLTTRAVSALRRDRSPVAFSATVAAVLEVPAPDALVVSRSLLVAPQAARLACSVTRADVSPERLGRSGLTPRAQQLRRAWTQAFGALPAGGFARGGVRSGHVDNSAHYEGRAIDVFFRRSTAPRNAGWVGRSRSGWLRTPSATMSCQSSTPTASGPRGPRRRDFVTTCTRVDRRETRCCATSTTCTWRWRAAGPFGGAE
jgi:hypothetical protein